MYDAKFNLSYQPYIHWNVNTIGTQSLHVSASIERWWHSRSPETCSRLRYILRSHIFIVQYLFSRKSCRSCGYVKNYGSTRQATETDQIRSMRIACWMTKSTDTYSEYVILIGFPLQQWLHEHASMWRLTYRSITCLVYNRVLARGVRGGCRGQCRALSYYRPIGPEDDTLWDNSDPDCLP
jgi:sensor c-di-GMP phosphodiesterase-like protein